MDAMDTDLCQWGARDPGNLLPYEKPMRIASAIDLSSLVKRCCGAPQHQRVGGGVASGAGKGGTFQRDTPNSLIEWGVYGNVKD